MKKLLLAISAASLSLSFPLSSFAEMVTVDMNQVAQENIKGESIGSVTFLDSKDGMIIKTDLSGLTPGPHGFHVHEKPDCGDNGLNAGGHFDPKNTGKHEGPFSTTGHLGDMPVLWADPNGVAKNTLIAPNLKVADLADHSIMIHADGDNYSDLPIKLGGGGLRVACTIIKASDIQNSEPAC